MKDDELNKFANQFINLWQENFSKAIGDQQIIDYMMQATANMQQFYDKSPYNQSTTPTTTNSHEPGISQLHWSQLVSRINELEQRLAAVEGAAAKGAAKNPAKRKK